MAEFQAKCPYCSSTLKSATAPPEGAKVKCPKCGKMLTFNRSGSSSGERAKSSAADSKERSKSSAADSKERKASSTSGVLRNRKEAKPGLWADFPKWSLYVTGGVLSICLLVGILAATGTFSSKSPKSTKKAVAAVKTAPEPEPVKEKEPEKPEPKEPKNKPPAKETKAEEKEKPKETVPEPKDPKKLPKEPDKYFEVVSDNPKEPWKKILSREGGFVALFPGIPQDKPAEKTVILETKQDEHLLRLKVIEASVDDLAEKGRGFLLELKDAHPGSKNKEITVRGFPGLEMIYETTVDEKTNVTTEQTILDISRVRVFQLSITSPKGKEDAALQKKFFDSFKLVDAK